MISSRQSLTMKVTVCLVLATLVVVGANAKSTSSLQGATFAPRRITTPPTTATTLPVKAAPLSDNLSENRESAIRGGAVAVVQKSDTPTSQELIGIASFIGIEMVFRKLFQAKSIRFPAQLAGCVALFVVMILGDMNGSSVGQSLCSTLSPGAGLLAKWMGVFFVPGLTMLPLAPLDAVGSKIEMVKALAVVVVGFFYSLALVAYSVLGVRSLLGSNISSNTKSNISSNTKKSKKKAKAAPTPTGPAVKLYAPETQHFLVMGTIVAGAISIVATRQNLIPQCQKPLETLFLGFATLASYVWGARLPCHFVQIVNPLVSSALVTLGIASLAGKATRRSLVQVLQAYTCKKLAPMEAGAGDLLLFLLSPSVISFAVGMYKGKTLIANNLPAIVTGVVTGSVGSLFGTAAACRLIGLGGSQGSVLRLAAVPRSTQTALGMIIAEMLGGDVAIAATLIILTGIFGGMVGVKTLDAWGVKDPVSRGLGIGSAGLSLGVVSIKGEPEAFAFAGLCLVLTAVTATSLASIPKVAELLISIAGGSAPKIVEAAASAM